MADKGPVQNLCEETTCSICLEYFTDPVTIDCGHNFCQTCITEAWRKSDGAASCPQCREPCQQRNFRPNRQLVSIVEIVKKFSLQMPKGVDAVVSVCERHQEPLKLFCEDDQAPICVVCDKSKEHREHKVIPKEEAFEEYQGQIMRHLEFLNKQRGEILSSKLKWETESQNLLKQTDMERQKIMSDFKQLHHFLEEQERLLLAQLKELDDGIKSCEDQHIAKLSKEMSSIDDLIKELEEKQKQPATEFLQNMRNILERCNKNKNKTMDSIAFPPGLKQQIDKFSKMHPFLEKETKKLKDTVLSGPPEERSVPFVSFHKTTTRRPRDFWAHSLHPQVALLSGPLDPSSVSDHHKISGFPAGTPSPLCSLNLKKNTAVPGSSFGPAKVFTGPYLHPQDTVLSGPPEKKDTAVPSLSFIPGHLWESNLHPQGEDMAIPKLVLTVYGQGTAQEAYGQATYGQATYGLASTRGIYMEQTWYDSGFSNNNMSCSSYVMGVERITSGTHSWVVDVGDENFWAVGVAKESLRERNINTLNGEIGIWAIGKIPNGAYYASTHPGISLGPSPSLSTPPLTFNPKGLRPSRIRVLVNYEAGVVTFHDADSDNVLFTFNALFSGEKICSFLCVGK